MNPPLSAAQGGKRFRRWRRLARSLLLVLSSGVLTIGCASGPESTLSQLAEARRLSAELRIQFTQASEATTHAVIADSDESGLAFTKEAERAKQQVSAAATALLPLLHSLQVPAASQLLEDFGRSFRDYQALDGSILALAVENTNVKAQKLAFGPASQAAVLLRDRLDAIVLSAPAKRRCQVEALTASVLLAVREIQILEAPHIAESSDAAMTRIEQQMTDLESTARTALTTLTNQTEPTGPEPLAAATTALDDWQRLHRQILALSRRNSNVRSLELALGRGRALSVTCDSKLVALAETLHQQGFKATR